MEGVRLKENIPGMSRTTRISLSFSQHKLLLKGRPFCSVLEMLPRGSMDLTSRKYTWLEADESQLGDV